MITIEVRNSLGVVVATFEQADLAFRCASERADSLGPLTVFAVETIRRERQLTAEPEISVARARRSARRPF
jgi:hypothetical protein